MWLANAAFSAAMRVTSAGVRNPSVSRLASTLWPQDSSAPVSCVLMWPSGVHTAAS